MEKRTFEEALEERNVRKHNSNVENLASADATVGENLAKLEVQVEEQLALRAEIRELAAQTTVTDNDAVWKLYRKALDFGK